MVLEEKIEKFKAFLEDIVETDYNYISYNYDIRPESIIDDFYDISDEYKKLKESYMKLINKNAQLNYEIGKLKGEIECLKIRKEIR